MEKRPANELESRVTGMASALREEVMPAPTSAAVERILVGRSVRPHGIPYVRVAIGAMACAAAILVATHALTPSPSWAAMVQKMERATAGVLRHEFTYERQPDGTWTVTGERYVDDTRMHEMPRAGEAELFVDGSFVWNYFPKEGYAIKETIDPSRSDRLHYRASLARQIGFDHVKWVKPHGSVRWKGQDLVRYDIHSEAKDALGQDLVSDGFIYADPTTDRPYYEEYHMTGDKVGVYKDHIASAMEWQYPESDHGALTVKIPPGTRVYDVATLRAQFKEDVTRSLATRRVAGIDVTLRAAYADEYGTVTVFTTGGVGRLDGESGKLRVDGREAQTFSSGQNHERVIDGEQVYDALPYRGLSLVCQAASFHGQAPIPDVVDLEVPVWRSGLHGIPVLAGYAKFEGVALTRIAGQVLTVMNRSVLWESVPTVKNGQTAKD